MKKTLVAACLATVMSTSAVMAESTALTSEDDRLSYSLGMLIGERILKQYSEDINYYVMLEGIRAAHQDKETALTMEEAQAAMQASEDKAIEEGIAKAKEAGAAYMAENAKKEGVKTTESGIQYEVLKEGSGDSPKATDQVSVHYVGQLIDGTTFDSSVDRGQPAEFGLNQVIPGWTEGVQLMNKGSKYRFVIPSELAYGDQGAGASIGPGETLIFEVELLDILSSEPAAE
ncbi:FKBP-type peptidyl-prolyl cis-trans isomerase [Leucothrix sargassi]|nr:FKBP-type peptidyl-prolyl cis-trans isomerase [Leucothrix sargassi]